MTDQALHVQEETQPYVENLLEQNERMATLVAFLHQENLRLARAVADLEEQVKCA
jgi:hypothetical protein